MCVSVPHTTCAANAVDACTSIEIELCKDVSFIMMMIRMIVMMMMIRMIRIRMIMMMMMTIMILIIMFN